MLRGEFIISARAESFTGKIFVNSIAIKGRMNIRKYAELLNSKTGCYFGIVPSLRLPNKLKNEVNVQ